MGQNPKEELKNVFVGARDGEKFVSVNKEIAVLTIHDLEFQARLLMLVAGYDEVSFCREDIASLAGFLLNSVRKFEQLFKIKRPDRDLEN